MTSPTSPPSHILRRMLVLGLLAACTVLALAAAFIYVTQMRAPSPPRFAAAVDRRTANRQDLQYLRVVMSYARSFSPQERAAFDASVDQLLGRAADLDPAALEMGMAQAVALADDGHTNVRGVGRGHHLDSIPLRLCEFAEGFFIVQTEPALAELLGSQLIALDGRAPETLSQALRRYVGGPPSLAREMLPNFLQSPAALHAAGLASSPAEVTLTLLLRNGTRVERTLAATPQPIAADTMLDFWPKRALSPVRRKDDPRQWRHVLDGRAQLPLYLRQPDAMYSHAYVDELQLIYIQLNAIRDEANGSLEAYLDSVLRETAEHRIRYAIVDLRFAPGGNYELSADFTKRLPQTLPVDGRLFILTSGNTFSAAIVTAARLKYFAGTRARIVGEPMGDREQFWAEGARVKLPNSGVVVSYARAYHDWEHGCLDPLKCYWMNWFRGVPAGKLSPDVPVKLRFADYLDGRDTAFELLAAQIRRARRTARSS